MKKRVRLKIYLKTAISFFILFSVVVTIITLIHSQNIRNTMSERSGYATQSLANSVLDYVKRYNDDKLMRNINYAIAGFSRNMSCNNMYSSVLMLDENKQVVTRSGNMLVVTEQHKDSTFTSFYIPLDNYFTNEQKEIFLKDVCSGKHSQDLVTSGKISGFMNSMKQLIPQKIVLNSCTNKTESFTFNFDNKPADGDTPYELKDSYIDLIVNGFGRENNLLSGTDRKRLNKCDQLAVRQISTACEDIAGTGGESDAGYVEFDGIGKIIIDNKTYYFAMAGQGFPIEVAISELMSLFIFFFLFMNILFLIVSSGFIKTYNQQLSLESSSRSLTNAIAHEMKTPLGIIRNYSEGLKEGIKEEKKDYYLGVIIEETEHMDNMLIDLLTLSGLESEKVRLNLSANSLRQMTDEALAKYQKPIYEKSNVVSVSISDKDIIKCDRKMIIQVISNFLSNAIRYVPKNGSIIISVEHSGQKLRYTIENSGEHIPENQINNIWDTFYKLDTARIRTGGTGLGLSIAKSILVLHHFKYGVQNTDKGVKFWFET